MSNNNYNININNFVKKEYKKIGSNIYLSNNNMILSNKNKIIKNREKKLINLFNENKLKIVYSGNIYSYINYGQPSLDKVFDTEILKVKNRNKRRIKLRIELKKKGLFMDESLLNCYNYINSIGYKNLSETIRAIEIEHFFKYNTNYNILLKNHDESAAKNIAIKEYIEKNGNNNNIITKIDNNLLLKFN